MEYPRLPKKLDRRCKLTEKDIYRIRILKENGWLLKRIAKKFNVSDMSIYYWTNENYRQESLERGRYKRHTDKERWNESKKYSYCVSSAIRKWSNEKAKKRYREKKQALILAGEQSLEKS